MLSLKCRKSSKNPRFAKTKKGKPMLLSKCAVCDSKRSKFIREQEHSGLLSSLGIKAGLDKNPILDRFSFKNIK